MTTDAARFNEAIADPMRSRPPFAENPVRVGRTSTVSSQQVWRTPDVDVWEADDFHQDADCYPVYQMTGPDGRVRYAAGPWPLLRLVGNVVIRPDYERRHHLSAGPYTPADGFLDPRVTRADRPPTFTDELDTRTAIVAETAAAVRDDVAETVAMFPGYHHVILCGGKDSLNGLLCEWSGDVTALSAEPNFPLVEEFVRKNRLPMPVERLDDPAPDAATAEAMVLANCCRMDLAHARWQAVLRTVAARHGGRVIFWCGAMADALHTPKWRAYAAYGGSRREQALRRRLPRAAAQADRAVRVVAARWPAARTAADARLKPRARRALFARGASWQGVSMSVIRGTVGAPLLSLYHGPQMTAVARALDLRAVTEDLRAEIGRALLGRTVWYPSSNPSPAPSEHLHGFSGLTRFLAAVQTAGLRVGEADRSSEAGNPSRTNGLV